MGTVSYWEIIVSIFKNPRAFGSIILFCILVITCHILRIKIYGYFCTFIRLKNRCFFKIKQLYRSLFKTTLCIRSLHIKLYNTFSCISTGIFYGDYSGSCASRIHLYTFQRLLKSSVRQTISKRICYLILILPGFSCSRTFCCICISLFQYVILIACFIIFISHINAFWLNHIPITSVCIF